MIQVVALMSVFGLGIAFSLLGSLKLELAKVLGIDDARVGGLISTLMFSSIFIVLAFGPLVDLFGYKPIAIIGFILGAVAVFMLTRTSSYGTAVFACVVLGVGAMCMNLGNTLIPMVMFEGNPAAASNFGNVFFGVGAFLTPLLAGTLLTKIGYKATGLIIALVLLIPGIIAIMASFPTVEQSGLTLIGAFGREFSLLARPVIIVAALILFCYIALETSMGGWISSYAAEQGYDERGANMVLSSFWIALMVARLIASSTVAVGTETWVLMLLAIVAIVSTGLMTVIKSKPLAALLVVVTGAAFGPIFPTVVGLTFGQVDESLYGSAFAIIFAVGLLGGSTVPAAIGIHSKGKSIQKSMIIATMAAIVLLVFAFIMRATVM